MCLCCGGSAWISSWYVLVSSPVANFAWKSIRSSSLRHSYVLTCCLHHGQYNHLRCPLARCWLLLRATGMVDLPQSGHINWCIEKVICHHAPIRLGLYKSKMGCRSSPLLLAQWSYVLCISKAQNQTCNGREEQWEHGESCAFAEYLCQFPFQNEGIT